MLFFVDSVNLFPLLTDLVFFCDPSFLLSLFPASLSRISFFLFSSSHCLLQAQGSTLPRYSRVNIPRTLLSSPTSLFYCCASYVPSFFPNFFLSSFFPLFLLSFSPSSLFSCSESYCFSLYSSSLSSLPLSLTAPRRRPRGGAA